MHHDACAALVQHHVVLLLLLLLVLLQRLSWLLLQLRLLLRCHRLPRALLLRVVHSWG